jgi:hypothetical protein
MRKSKLAVALCRSSPQVRARRGRPAIWERVVARHGLERRSLGQLAHWAFADFVFAQDYDVVSRTTRLRRAGFSEIMDSEEMVLDHLTRYREARLLP